MIDEAVKEISEKVFGSVMEKLNEDVKGDLANLIRLKVNSIINEEFQRRENEPEM